MQRRRLVYGLAYNQLIKGPRRTNRCRIEAMNDPNDYYYDEAIRITEDEMREIDLRGLPLCHKHDPNRVIGSIMDHWVDEQGLRIMAEITDDTVIDEIDRGELAGLSVGYTSDVNMDTGEIVGRTFHEISACKEPFFEQCQISVLASKNSIIPKNGFEIRILKVEASGPEPTSQSNQMSEPVENTQPSEPADPAPAESEEKSTVAAPSQAPHETSLVQRYSSTLEENKQLKEMLAEFQAEKEKQRQQYAEERAPIAKETTEIYRETLKERGFELTPQVEALIQRLITAPEGGAMAEIQVTAARAIAESKKRIKTLEEENKKLADEQKQLQEVFSAETNVDRDFRRMAKVTQRSEKTETPQKIEQDVPHWYNEILGMSKPFAIPTRVAKKVTTPPAPAAAAPTPANVAAVPTAASHEAPQARVPQPLPGVRGAPVNPLSFRNVSDMTDIWSFLNAKDVSKNASGRMYTHKAGQRIGSNDGY